MRNLHDRLTFLKLHREYYAKKIEYYQQKYQYEQDQQNAYQQDAQNGYDNANQNQENVGNRQLYNSNSAYMANQADGSHVNKITCDQCVKECFDENSDIAQTKLEAEMYASGQIYRNAYSNNYSPDYYNNNNNQEANQQQDEDIEFAALAEWVAEITNCKNSGYQYNNQNLYAGFMCNADGSGIEVGLFLDEYCSIYTKEQSFSAAAQSSSGDELT